MKTVLVRADASSTIGSGHVMRCLTLATALRERGASVAFVCRGHPGHLGDVIRERGFQVTLLPLPATANLDSQPVHAAWLGDSWEADAAQTKAVIDAMESRPDWLVVDHYAVDEKWETALRGSVCRIMVIDDLADRRHACDVLLDQNIVQGMLTRYDELLPHDCVRLLGADFALLQPEYAELRPRIPPRSGAVRDILVFFGGADSDDFTGRTLAALLQIEGPAPAVHVVINSSSPHAAAIRASAASSPNIRVYDSLPTLAGLIARADLAIGAGGATNYERLCLGLPGLVVTLADNQVAIASGLADRGVIRWLGHRDSVDAGDIAAAVGDVIGNGIDEQWSRACAELVDGEGTRRVVAVLEATEESVLCARGAVWSDRHIVSAWTRESGGRRNSHEPAGEVELAAQRAEERFRHKLRALDTVRLLVIETSLGVPVALAEVTRDGSAWTADCELSTLAQQRGMGSRALEAAVRKLREETPGTLTVSTAHSTSETKSGRPASLSLGVCTSRESWINPAVAKMMASWIAAGHVVSWVHDAAAVPPGDICFYLGYERIVDQATLRRYDHNLVVHASALPKGRGWSPLTWQVLEGHNRIPVTLFEAAETVDSGPIYDQVYMELNGVELLDEMRGELAHISTDLCDRFVGEYPSSGTRGVPQEGDPTFYPRRRPVDGRLDVDRPLRDHFNLLRTADPERYPAWCEIAGTRFAVKLERLPRPHGSGPHTAGDKA